jgi:hypothetical protein
LKLAHSHHNSSALTKRFDTGLMSRNFVLSQYLRLNQDTPATEKRYPLESMTGVMFMHIISNLGKPDHNMLFAQKRSTYEAPDVPDPNDAYADTNDGPMVYLDNDRARFDQPYFPYLCDSSEVALANVCRFPRQIARRILVFGQNTTGLATAGVGETDGNMPPCSASVPEELGEYCDSTTTFTLGGVMLELSRKIVADGMADNGELFTCRDAYGADLAVQYWYNIINRCIAEYGEEAVLIREPWVKEYDMWGNLARFH